MIFRTVAWALHNQSLVLGFTGILVLSGLAAYGFLNIEAYPNPVPPLVEVITQPQGWNAQEVERFITVPLEAELFSIKGISHIRSQSLFGLSDIKCYFEWGTDYWEDRQEVINRLGFVTLPGNLTASISPLNAIGELYRYILVGPYPTEEIKATQDWILERQWPHAAGVIDVTSFGGKTKTFNAYVDRFAMVSRGIDYQQIAASIAASNSIVSGGRLPLGEQSFNVRGAGLLNGIEDLKKVVVRADNANTPVLLRDIADVRKDYKPRLGVIGHDDDDDVVQGIVLMRYDGETKSTIEAIQARAEYIRKNHLLPPGMQIKPYYDRSHLVSITTHTVIENMVVGIVLVTVVLLFFLGNLQAALITALNIPLALFVSFIGFVASKSSANLISLGAVDFGIVVDSTVIMVENVFHHLGANSSKTMVERILSAAREVVRPLGFSMMILAVSFIPLFTLTGVAGVIFAPMARTYALAIFGAIVLALSLTPVLLCKFISPNLVEKPNRLLVFMGHYYDYWFEQALRHPVYASMVRLVPILLCFVLFPFLGQDFMPQLEEGNLWIRATLPTSISFDKSFEYVNTMRRLVRGCPLDSNLACVDAQRTHPEVTTVVSQLGRPDDGTDVCGFYNIELFAPLKPQTLFGKQQKKTDLIATLQTELQAHFPGVVFNFSQMIGDNVQEAVSGVKGENSLKVFGPTLEENDALAEKIMSLMRQVPGVADLGIFRSLGQPSVTIRINRTKAALLGLNIDTINQAIEMSLAGISVTQFLDGLKRFDVVVRLREDQRRNIEDIEQIPVRLPSGDYVPLVQLADIAQVDGPLNVYREDGERYTPIKFSVRGRDLGSTITQIQQSIDAFIDLPFGNHLEFAGNIGELQTSQARLAITIPLSLGLIAVLVYGAVKSFLDTLIVLIDIPVACTGGLLALMLSGEHFSVSAAMGFVSIFGIAIQDAILVVTYFQDLFYKKNMSAYQAAKTASEKRFRPVLMTTLVATLGLLPAATSTAIGAQAQRPLAIVVIGGSLMVALLTRILQPTLLVYVYRNHGSRA